MSSKTVHRNDGEIDFVIGAAIAEGAGFYRVRIADTDDANLRAFSGLIELVGVVAEGASVLANEAAAPNDDGSMMLLLAIVGGVVGVCVVIAAIGIITAIVIVVLRAAEEEACSGSHSRCRSDAGRSFGGERTV